MDLRKDIISNAILKSFVFIGLLIGFTFSLIAINQGIVIGDDLISTNNYILVEVLLISFIVLITINLIYTIVSSIINVKNIVNNELPTDYKLDRFEFIELIMMVFALTFIIYLVILFPLAYDSLNNYAFSFSIAMLILALTYVVAMIFNKYFRNNRTAITIDIISEGSVLAALAVVLSVASDLIPGLKMPNGGSFSLSMLPLFIFALRRGVIPGLIMGAVYSVVNLLVDGLIIHWGSIFFDYLLPFALLAAIAGIFSKKALKGQLGFTVVAVLLGGLTRYIFHGLSGVIFFAEYAGEYNPWFYSFIVYNLPYMAVSTIGVLITTILLQKRFITLDSRIQ